MTCTATLYTFPLQKLEVFQAGVKTPEAMEAIAISRHQSDVPGHFFGLLLCVYPELIQYFDLNTGIASFDCDVLAISHSKIDQLATYVSSLPFKELRDHIRKYHHDANEDERNQQFRTVIDELKWWSQTAQPNEFGVLHLFSSEVPEMLWMDLLHLC